jgi:hypothetical protein
METGDAAEPDEARAWGHIISQLRSIMLTDPFVFSYERIVLFGEQPLHPDARIWANRLLHLPGYGGPVTCKPWSPDASIVITHSTASEVCSTVLRAVYAMLFPDFPIFIRTEPLEAVCEKVAKYVIANSDKLNERLQHIYDSANAEEWFRIIALAEVEQSRLWHGVPSGATQDSQQQRLMTRAGQAANKTARKPRTTPEQVDVIIKGIFQALDENPRSTECAEKVRDLLSATSLEAAGNVVGCDRKTMKKTNWWNNDRDKQRQRYFADCATSTALDVMK